MVKKIHIFLVLLLFLLCIGTASAANDVNETNDDFEISVDNSSEILQETSHTINDSNYNQYFDSKGNLVSSNVKQGDTLNFDGSFSSKKFVFNQKINIVGTGSNNMKNSMITLRSGASGSSVYNLSIQNTNAETYGIFLNSASNCIVKNCVIKNTGRASYTICIANGANHNNVSDNDLKTYGITYGHGTRSTPTLIVSGSHYNYIANNKVEMDDANGIYLSSYDGGPLNGGISNFNIIYNNTVHCNNEILPTSWSYSIQVMGNNNTIQANKVIRGYRGISTAGSSNKIIDNVILNITGADYNHIGVETGGEFAIVGSSNAIVINNIVSDSKIISSGAGISALDNSIIENNWVNITKVGRGITAGGSNVTVRNNTIFTVSGSGIYQKDEGSNLLVENNNVTSVSGIGVLIEKLNSKRMPSNVTVIGNVIRTGNSVGIDVSGVQANSSYIEADANDVGGKLIKTPAGIIDTSKTNYIYKGKVLTITNATFDKYINVNGGLTSEVDDGDILNFVGSFDNKVIYVNKEVKITGKNPIFYNSTFKVTSGNVLIENLTIINKQAERVNAWGIFTNQAFGVRIQNNNIYVSDPKAAYAIYILESANVDVWNNNLTSQGDYLTFTLLSYASEECNFTNNKIRTIGTGQVYSFSPERCIDGNELVIDGKSYCIDGNELVIDGKSYCIDGEEVVIDGKSYCIDGNELVIDGKSYGSEYSTGTAHVVSEIYQTYGILLLYSSNNYICLNNVNVTSKLSQVHPTTGEGNSTNSLVGIDLYFNSHNNLFLNNTIDINAIDNYIYGMGVLGYRTGHKAPEGQGATNNIFDSNTINLNGSYFTTGLIVGCESINTILKDNTINLKANGVAYGITLELSQINTIENNNINLNSEVIYGIEAVSSNNNTISSNDFKSQGKQVYGMLISNGESNIISKNIVFANGSGNQLTVKNLDSLSSGNAGIYLKSNSTNNQITDNNVTSTKGYAVLIDDIAINNLIVDNYLNCENGIANDALYNSNGNTVKYNYIFIANSTVTVSNIGYLGQGQLNVALGDNLNGATVKFYNNHNEILDEVSVLNGVASLNLSFNESYIPAKYMFTAQLFKENYKTSIFNISFEITNANPNVIFNPFSIIQGDSGEVLLRILDPLGQPISGANVNFNMIRLRNIFIGSAVSDSKGIARISYDVPVALDVGQYNLRADISGLDYYNDINVTSNLTVLPRLNVTFTINPIMYVNDVVAILKDSNGDVVSNKKIVLNIDSKTFYLTTNDKGEVILPLSVKNGVYQINISSSGEGKYNEGNAYAQQVWVINPIMGNKDYTVYSGNTVEYKVCIVGKNLMPLSGKTVTFTVNGKKFDVITGQSGYASCSVKLGAGKYTISATYGNYSVFNQITFKPILSAKNIVKKKAKKIKFKAKLVNKNGKALKNKKVSFKIKGKSYKVKTNKKGIAVLVLKNLKVGSYKITSKYGSYSIKNTIKVKK